MAIADFRDLENLRETHFKRLQGLIALAALMFAVSASHATKDDFTWSHFGVLNTLHLIFLATVWASLIAGIGILVFFQRPRKFKLPPALNEHVKWRDDTLRSDLQNPDFSPSWPPARHEAMAKAVLDGYLKSAEKNRSANETRQIGHTWATKLISIAAVALLLQFLTYVFIEGMNQ